MASSTLNLHILKGPKEGEILTRKPGTQIRIGRVIKGNNFTIKDPAISQKHISIQFDFEISKWVLQDLDTSNGTILNDVKIKSLVQIPLSDGDIIKIGETTSISVKVELDGEFGNNNLRRGRSKAQNNSKGLKKDENLEGNVDESEIMNPRRAGLRSRGGSKLSENLVPVVDDSKVLQKNAKRGRTKKTNSQKMVSSEINEEKEGGFEKIEEKEIQSAEEERNEIMESFVEDSVDRHKNEKMGRKRNAPNTNRASSAKVLKCIDVENARTCANTEEKEGGLKENIETLVVDNVEEKENVQNKKIVKEKENVQQKENVQDKKTVEEKENVQQKENVQDKKTVKEKENVQDKKTAEEKENVQQKENVEEKENVQQKENVEEKEIVEEETEKEIDFEKMTLGEWFDSLEKYLPLAINEAAEARIAELREQARRFEEYIENGIEELL